MAAFFLDKALIIDRLGGDEEIFAMMLDMYIQDFGSNCAALASTLAANDVGALQREAHTVKGLLATFADDEGAEMALAIEMQVKAGNLAGLEAPIAALQARMREVGEVLKAAAVGQA